ncbi:DNA-directed RNA polymerase subunit D [Candidatus Woesearchaeota archaeon]|nr:DNA-directed RNA polymerase subunit D [Candidatus Woesearchaeota archaeon]
MPRWLQKERRQAGQESITMKLKALNMTDQKAQFLLEGVSISYANSLRRYFINETPIMAIEDVEIADNSSILYDESVALRLGLLVLETDRKSYNLPSACKCQGKGCAQCQAILTLKAKGPKTVYAGDMKSKDPKIKPVHPKTPIVKLLEGQKLEVTCTAVLGVGSTHAKWSPGHAYYNHPATVTVDTKKVDTKKIAEAAGDNVMEAKGDTFTVLHVDQFISVITALGAQEKGTPVVDQERFVFTIEPWGQLSSYEMVQSAIDAFNHDLDQFAEALE